MSLLPNYILFFSKLFIFISIIANENVFGGYVIEFEILNYKNEDGRLLSGECCNGLKKSSGPCDALSGQSCNPFWKICLTHQSKEMENVAMPIQNRSYPTSLAVVKSVHRNKKPARTSSKTRQDPAAVTLPPVVTSTTEKPSFFKSIYNRIIGSLKSVQSLTDYVSFGDMKSSYSSSPACSLAFWAVNVTQEVSENKTLFLRSEVPSSVIKLKKEAGQMLKTLVFVEVWSRRSSNESEDKLITRHVEQRNVSIQSLVNVTGDEDQWWTEGGITPSLLSSSLLPSNASFRGTEFRYRWRILSEQDEVAAESTTPIICPSGFKGMDCKEPICAPGCNANHGYCEKPGECKCKFGWSGKMCNSCLAMPGCVHGGCVKPFECRCEEGWSGMFCDKPSCKLGCHPQNGYCEHPGECRCRFGFKGENCSDCATMPGCQRGSCDQPLDCNCHQGWKGLFCSIPTCSEGCDLDHGWCRRPDECRCRVGWTGANCTECVPYPGCEHGSCSEPWTCNCDPGFGGVACNEKLDFCETSQSNPCQNGATCVSVEKADGGFSCQCPDGYDGHYCEKKKTDSL